MIAHSASRPRFEIAPGLIAAPFKVVHGFVILPAWAFLATLTAMLFRPPDLKAVPIDRIAFILLLMCIGAYICLRGERLRIYPATWPMLTLLLLGICATMRQPYDSQSWSLLAAKWLLPFALFHLAPIAFCDANSLRKLEVFCLIVLIYLTAISVFYLADAKSLIWPNFILDESIGIHADRARGPFLQAVANGVCLNLLGLIALDSFRRRRLRGLPSVILLFAVPLALLATRTRAVWLSAAVSIVLLANFGDGRVRRASQAISVLVLLGFCASVYQNNTGSLGQRLEDRSPVDFRVAMYRAGWQMFAEKPLTGWGSGESLQTEISRRVWDFHPEYFVFHNTYLELAIERGLVGLVLYAWLMFRLLQLSRPVPGTQEKEEGEHFLDRHFRKLWPIMLAVYLLNGSAVVMNYQFVNGFLFTIAGILAAQNFAAEQRAPMSQEAL